MGSLRPRIAALLSALLPGLGQFYNRQWSKGAGFLIGVLTLDGILGISSETLTLLQNAASGTSVNGNWVLLLRMLPLLALTFWSITDAARTAKRLL